ncbi:MAG: 50S ribosomal protein L4 [candidate division Zixibacteria bacterium RBG_16_53_22]|nr:MAG: 50S ribosomal protein L4 [candidate division Zixibacteria bacterium RBG_16_53_22]
MPDVKFISKDGTEARTVTLSGPLFETEPKGHVIQEYVKGFLRNQRQGTASTLNRARMKGGGKKPFRQKGTGRARAGSNTSPLWTGGAVVFGPTPKDHYSRLPKALKRNALLSALSMCVKEGNFQVVELPDLPEAKTKHVTAFLKKLGLYDKRTILLYDGKNDNLTIASRNIRNFEVKRAELVNPYDIMRHERVLATEQGLEKIKETFGNG